jgi:hypothetical protein
MTKEQIEALNKLQGEISEVTKHLDLIKRHRVHVSFPGYSQYESLNLEKYPALRDDHVEYLRINYESILDELLAKRDTIILCKAGESMVTYDPIRDEDLDISTVV